MKQSSSTSAKLTRLIWRERLQRAGVGAAVIVLLGAAAYLTDAYRSSRADPTIEAHEVAGAVTGFGSGNAARGGYILHVHIDDGRDVDAFATTPVVPAKGAHIVLTEARHKSGRVTFDLLKVIE